MLIPMVLSHREKAWWYATIATVTSVLGGILGYAIGYFAYQTVGLPILEFYGKAHALDSFISFVHDYGVEAVIIKGMTPIPFKVVTIAAGVAQMAFSPSSSPASSPAPCASTWSRGCSISSASRSGSSSSAA